MKTNNIYILWANNHAVAASPSAGAVRYCFNALKLEGFDVREEVLTFDPNYPPIQIDYLFPGEPCFDLNAPFHPAPHFSTPLTFFLFDTVDKMREIIHERL